MAWMESHRDEKRVEVDLHAYYVDTALDVAKEKVREAWENGYLFITLIHGWRQHVSTSGTPHGHRMIGRIRGELLRGVYKRWAFYRYSTKHKIEQGSTMLALRHNPAPRVPEVWTPMPEAEFERERGTP